MEIFDVFIMNGIENYPTAGEFFLENVILIRSHRHTFPRISIPRGANAPLDSPRGGHTFFKGGGQCPPRGAVKYPDT